MKGKKKFTIGVLRAIGVCALVGILIGALAFLEKDHSVEPAQIIFAGTKDDADCAILQSGGSVWLSIPERLRMRSIFLSFCGSGR